MCHATEIIQLFYQGLAKRGVGQRFYLVQFPVQSTSKFASRRAKNSPFERNLSHLLTIDDAFCAILIVAVGGVDFFRLE